MSLVDQVAAQAATFRAVRAVLTILAAPFFVAGIMVGVLWLAVAWAWAAVQVGMIEARRLARPGEHTDRPAGT